MSQIQQSLSLVLCENHVVCSEKEQRKHGFNHVQYNIDFLKHEFIKLSKDYLYLGTEEIKYDILKHCCNAMQINRLKLILLITTIAHITWLFMISPQDPFYSALPPKKRHLWALPEATNANPNKTDKYFINPSFFTPCSHCAIVNVKSQIIFIFQSTLYLTPYPYCFLSGLGLNSQGKKGYVADRCPLSV